MGWLFNEVSHHFNDDDYVSWVHIRFADANAVARAYRRLRDGATGLVNEDAYAWSYSESREIPVD